MRCKHCGHEIELDGLSARYIYIHSPYKSSEYRWYTCYNHFKNNGLGNNSFESLQEAEPDLEYEAVTKVLDKYNNGQI